MARQLRRDEYTVGWVCALPVELATAQEMLDEEHHDLERDPADNDENLYTLGSIGGHNVAIVCLPAGRIGNNPAAAVSTQMRATFKAIRFGLMVGIGGGVPSTEADIRLGDVVVSQPHKLHGGVVQYDVGKTTRSGFERTGSLNSPPHVLLSAVAKVRANELRRRSKLLEHASKLERIARFRRVKAGPDILFKATYDHDRGQTCDWCSVDGQELRQLREGDEEVVVHYGTIASGNRVMRSAVERDQVSAELGGVLCFEMEAAGLMNSFPCLVIRGICDYADSHKNKAWQPYAAATAAAYAKEVLSVIPPAEVAKEHTVDEAIREASDELCVLQQKLMVDQDCQKLSIVGLGGTGKTQVALQFAYSVKETLPEWSIFWVPALSMESFEQACVSVAGALRMPYAAIGEEDVKELVQQHLSSSQAGRWLLVVDNADDADIFFGTEQSRGIVDYLPESKTGVVVYTTRTPEVAELTRGDVIELGAMDRQDAVAFLTKSLMRKDLLCNDAITNKLLDELTSLPLAIAQAAAYLNRNRMPVAKYMQLLRSTEYDMVALMSKEFRDDTRYKGSANAVAATWVVSFNQICERDEAAANLLAFISCVEWKAIPRSLLRKAQSEVQSWIQTEDAIGTLCGYSFLTRRGNNEEEEGNLEEEWYDMHRLVHLATRIWLRKRSDIASVLDKAVRQVAYVFPSDDYANRTVWRAYLPHASRLLEFGQQCSIKEKSELCLLVGQCLRMDGRTTEAVRWLEESWRRRETLNEDDLDRLCSQCTLAMAYEDDGQVQKAVELLEHAVAVREKVLAEEHPHRLASQHVLAMAYQTDGQVQKAVKLLEYTFEVERNVLAEEHIDQLAPQDILAIAYQADGQVQKAVELLEHIVSVREKLLVEEHPHRLASQHVLAMAYQSNGQVQKAIELLKHVVAVHKKALAEEHPHRLASQYTLAVAYQENGQLQKAVELLEHVVTVREKALAEEHPHRLASQYTLAIAYQESGQVQKAVELLEYVVDMQEMVLAEEHPHRLASQHVLAMAYQADGQVQKAVELLGHVVAVRKKVLAEEHPSQLASQHALAIAYQENRQVQKAVELLEHVVTVRKKVLAKVHPHQLASQYALAIAYQVNGQVQKAVELLEHVVAVRKKVLAEEHPHQLASQYALAIAYQVNGQVQKAVELLEYVIDMQEMVLAEEHPHRLASQQVLALVYQSNGQVQKAVELLEHVVAVRKKVLVEEHPHRLSSQHALAMAYQADRQVQKAIELLEHVVAIRHDHPSQLVSVEALAVMRAKLAIELDEASPSSSLESPSTAGSAGFISQQCD